jgi:hypothetical protein
MEIENHQLTWYMQDVCMHALGAHLDFQNLLATLGVAETQQTRLVWFHLTSFLHHTAMISKFVNPISKHRVAIARGKALRAALDVKQGSEVLPRHARDNVEHFDERIDRWIDGRSSHTILEVVLPNREGYDFLRVGNKRIKRVLIADCLIFVSEAKDSSKFELSLRPVYEEVARIGGAAENWMGLRSPYQYVYPGHLRVG